MRADRVRDGDRVPVGEAVPERVPDRECVLVRVLLRVAVDVRETDGDGVCDRDGERETAAARTSRSAAAATRRRIIAGADTARAAAGTPGVNARAGLDLERSAEEAEAGAARLHVEVTSAELKIRVAASTRLVLHRECTSSADDSEPAPTAFGQPWPRTGLQIGHAVQRRWLHSIVVFLVNEEHALAGSKHVVRFHSFYPLAPLPDFNSACMRSFRDVPRSGYSTHVTPAVSCSPLQAAALNARVDN